MAGQQPIIIDYTNLGYDSLREAMLALARERMPEWTDFSESDLGVLLVELFAYANDITQYYQTRIANNLLPASTDEPDALVQLLRLIGYELRPPAPATVDLCLAVDATAPLPVVIPPRAQFVVSTAAGEQVTFETEREFRVQPSHLTPPDAQNLRYVLYPIPVVEGRTFIDNPVGVSDGSPNQIFSLRQKPVIAGSIEVRVNGPGGVTRWQEVETLATSAPADGHFIVQRDSAGMATIVFGDATNGMIPPRGSVAAPVTIEATYRVGGGALGNVQAGAQFKSTLTAIRRATNPQAAAGSAASEDIDRARFFAPRLYRAQERAVTRDDYVDLALQAPGVGKALAVALNWNQVVLYIAPTGQVAEPSELLKRDLLAFFESRRMTTTSLTIVGPQPADIYLGAVVRAQPYFLQTDVRAAVEEAVAGYLAFEAVEFGQPIYLSKIYDVIQSLPQVASLTIFKFSRTPGLPADITTNPDVDSDGVIELRPDEMPRPGYRDNPNTPPAPALPNPPSVTARPTIYTIIQGGVAQ